MGIWERASDAFLERLGAEFAFEPPRRHGLDTVETIKAMHAGRVKVFFGMGGNFLTPSTRPRRCAAAGSPRRFPSSSTGVTW
jgi:hypothetical protein